MSDGFRGSSVEMSEEWITDDTFVQAFMSPGRSRHLTNAGATPVISSHPQRTIHVVSCQCGISEMLMKFWQTADKRERDDPTDKAITFNKTSFLVCHFLPGFFMNTQTEWIDVMHTRNDKCLKERKKSRREMTGGGGNLHHLSSLNSLELLQGADEKRRKTI